MGRKVIDHRHFVRDLERGAKGEKIVEDFFKEEFGLLAENVSKGNSDYDLKVSTICKDLEKSSNVVPSKLFKKILRDSLSYNKKKSVTIEVKYDEAAAKYRNFFIELIFDIEKNVPGALFKCKADLVVWVVPDKNKRKKTAKIYLFKRPELISWLFQYVHGEKKVTFKTPSISPYARGLTVPISKLTKSFACVGEYDFKL